MAKLIIGVLTILAAVLVVGVIAFLARSQQAMQARSNP